MKRPRARFEVLKVEGKRAWYWHLLAGNGEILCVSEEFTRKADALRAAKITKASAQRARIA